MVEKLIEEAAKALFFRDMVDGQVSQNAYDIWEVDTEPDAEVGERIRAVYRETAKENLKSEGYL